MSQGIDGVTERVGLMKRFFSSGTRAQSETMAVVQRKRTPRRVLAMSLWMTCMLAPAAISAQNPPPAAGVPSEAIQIHGHWTIEIRNPDGSIAARHEFQNQLVGGTLLAMLFNRELRLGTWLVGLQPAGASSACADEPWLGAGCWLGEAGETRVGGPSFFPSLTVSRGGASDVVVLTGAATADTNGNIGVVRTFVAICSLPDGACGNNFASVTQKALSPNTIAVSQGQILSVTVRLSFSTAP